MKHDHNRFWSPKDFGAAGTGRGNDLNAFQMAIDAASVDSGTLIIPEGDFLLAGAGAQLLLVEKPINIIGVSRTRSRIIIDAGVPLTTDIIRLHPQATISEDYRGQVLQDFTIAPISGAPGRDGIVIDTSDAGISELMINRVRVSAIGGNSIASINPLSAHAFFCSQISRCFLEGGIRLELAGDSISVHRNTIPVAEIGIEASFVVGSNNFVISQNNMTPRGPAILIHSAYRPVIRENNIEALVGGNYPTTPLISLLGDIAEIQEPMLYGNSLLASLVAGTDAIRLDHARRAYVGPQVIYTATTGIGVVTTANTVLTKIDKDGISWAAGVTLVNDVAGDAIMPTWEAYA